MFTNIDTKNHTVEQTIYINPLRYSAKETNVNISGMVMKVQQLSTIVQSLKFIRLEIIKIYLIVTEFMITVNMKMLQMMIMSN